MNLLHFDQDDPDLPETHAGLHANLPAQRRNVITARLELDALMVVKVPDLAPEKSAQRAAIRKQIEDARIQAQFDYNRAVARYHVLQEYLATLPDPPEEEAASEVENDAE